MQMLDRKPEEEAIIAEEGEEYATE